MQPLGSVAPHQRLVDDCIVLDIGKQNFAATVDCSSSDLGGPSHRNLLLEVSGHFIDGLLDASAELNAVDFPHGVPLKRSC